MKIKRINYRYLHLLKEPILLISLFLRNLKKRKHHPNPKKVLIINPSLVGEFAVSVSAIRSFIESNNSEVDLVVSPAVKSLAEKIKGINNVFTIKSIYGEDFKKNLEENSKLKQYDLVIVMRISSEANKLIKSLKYNQLRSYLGTYFKFIFEFAKNMLTGGKTRQWKEITFEMIGRKPKKFNLEELFNFKKSDYEKVKGFAELVGKEKKVLIHTASDWSIKKWDNKNWIGLLNKMNELGNFKFIFLGTKDAEQSDYEEISKALKFKVYSLINKIDLKELVLVMKKSDYFVGIDSGPMNLAHLVDLPNVCLFGPGQRIFTSGNKRDVIIDKSNCKFCTTILCYKRKTCFNKIEVSDVLTGFKQLVGKK